MSGPALNHTHILGIFFLCSDNELKNDVTCLTVSTVTPIFLRSAIRRAADMSFIGWSDQRFGRNNHIMDWDKGQIITSETNKFKRWIKEAIEIRKQARDRPETGTRGDTPSCTPGISCSRDHPGRTLTGPPNRPADK